MTDVRLLAAVAGVRADVTRALGAVAADTLADALTRTLGDDEVALTFEHHAPLSWIVARAVRSGARVTLLHVHGAWQAREGVDAFAALVAAASVLPDAATLARAYGRLLGAEPLLVESDARDHADPRWNALPWGAETVARWTPPHVDGETRSFCVEERRALMRVAIDAARRVSVERL